MLMNVRLGGRKMARIDVAYLTRVVGADATKPGLLLSASKSGNRVPRVLVEALLELAICRRVTINHPQTIVLCIYFVNPDNWSARVVLREAE